VTSSGGDTAWRAVLAAAQQTEQLAARGQAASFDLIAWDPAAGWQPAVGRDHPAYQLLDLYLPLCNATAARPITVGHLGQSLDGFIATHGGDSQFVTGHENIVHMHRLRALCDAVVVGAGTVAADDPQLTTRLVEGPSPLRVVFDPARRLDAHYGLFTDAAVETMYVCGRSAVPEGETHIGRAAIVAVDDDRDTAVSDLQRLLVARGCRRILVEGGGVTVSRFLKENLLDRLQVTVAPFIIGDGRPAIRLPAPQLLRDCGRPRHRTFVMGGDVLFELVMRE
jgi:diaminohydroxyphosphoribosylaminopyrimidine deaminase / 5-amino-6-(5-phosphoribosylamino)uracil reductase